MRKTCVDDGAPFRTIAEASRLTGLSMYYLRNGCIAGTVPHVRCGTIYRVDVPALLEKLRAENGNASTEGDRG